MLWHKRIDAIIDAELEQIIGLRRHLHANPEPSGEEAQTSVLLYQRLGDLGLDVKIGPEGRGLLVESRRQTADKRIALRGDIDALRIQDEKNVPYRSQCDGVMHACGHDAHTACLFGALLAMDQLEREGALPGPVTWRGIFQPSEETATGAKQMVGAGAMKGVNAAIALHVDPNLPVGQVGVRSGVLTANAEMMRIEVHGAGGHAARPHESHDPIAAAAQLISTLYQFVPRKTDSRQAVVVTIGRVDGGHSANVIPERVLLEGTVRTLDRAVQRTTLEHIRHLAHGVAEITGTRIEVSFPVSIPAVENDATLSELIRSQALLLLGQSGVRLIDAPSMGSEDFSVYGDHAPIAMFRLGAAAKPPGPALHTPHFDIDERCLAIGAKLLARSAVMWGLQGINIC
ncbi:putative hydrolase YxeP [Posidoniimonas polymericola]|uniref:Putative hydrolase YxeP n=1 Tax=Posidoniimonas polymericola TaxID=2528002 RepID=A0A5C5YES5_9BACT|nr:amidohydrolase [Posidoniimonas polymericola]TWT73544.1 putative hydrolase YxeP [Posidoniimonas polymericola]